MSPRFFAIAFAVLLALTDAPFVRGQITQLTNSNMRPNIHPSQSEGPGWMEFRNLSRRLEVIEAENAWLRAQQNRDTGTHPSNVANPATLPTNRQASHQNQADGLAATPVAPVLSMSQVQAALGTGSVERRVSYETTQDGNPVPLNDASLASPTRTAPRGGGQLEAGDLERFQDKFYSDNSPFNVGVDLYSPPDFEGGLIVSGRNIAMKIGGLVKADFIYDFDPIESTDSFITTTIPVEAADRTNARYHARQTRMSFDTRWATNDRTVRIYVESDFFDENNRFRLRHAYGEVGSLLVGQTSTTFHDIAASPATLDFEGSVSSVNRRQALARWTQPVVDGLTAAVAIEDARFIIQAPPDITVDARTPSPDFVGHLRLETQWCRFQLGGIYRLVGVQPSGDSILEYGDKVYTGNAWGLNFVGAILLSSKSKAYYQVVFGDGIGSYRGLPDAAPTARDNLGALPIFGWMVGTTHNWNDRLSSNFTYAENSLDNTAFQEPDDVHRTTYLAANLIWNPLERVKVGVEYLYGLRENVDRAVGSANRVQVAFIFDLP